jgi:transcriptional regulator with XRE-family HTH domain
MPKYATQPKPAPIKSQDPESLNNRHLVKSEFAKRLHHHIISRGWTQSEFARHCEIPRDAISTYVRGRSMPSPTNLDRMASVLGVRPEELMPNYYESAQAKADSQMELRDVPNEEGYMWLKLNLRLPKKVAIQIFLLAQESQ